MVNLIRILFLLFFTLSANAAYVSSIQILDTNGNTIDSATTAPAGTERGLVCRNIPSGVQATTNSNIDVLLSTRATESTVSSINTNLTNRTQKTQITNGTNDAAVTNTDPATSSYGLVTRPIPVNKPTFVVVADTVAIANNKSMIAIQNTGTSVLKIRRIYITNIQTGATTGIIAQMNVHRITSFTGGTPLTPGAFDTADALPAGITAATNSTITGESTLYKRGDFSSDEWGTGTLDKEGFDQTLQQLHPFYFDLGEGKSITLRQNQGVHIKCLSSTTNGTFNITIEFTTE